MSQSEQDVKDDVQDPQFHGNEWWELIKTGVIALLIAAVIRTILFEPFNIPSGSMKPNLLVGDYLFVSKFSYGYSQYSTPFGIIPIEGRVNAQPIERGDVAVFKLPSNNKTDYIKRVIGLPGDKIQVIRGRLYINGFRVPRERVGEVESRKQIASYLNATVRMTEYVETLPNGVTYHIYEESDQGPLDDTPVFTVPEGHYFMMGDNRDNSQDSRVMQQVGFVPYKNFVGRAERIFFSIGDGAQIWEIWRWPAAIRYDRLFQSISGGKS
tara:strand:- start:475 stop:1278 length:804 start_codon:yes stop_codon:yes gene_type:complete